MDFFPVQVGYLKHLQLSKCITTFLIKMLSMIKWVYRHWRILSWATGVYESPKLIAGTTDTWSSGSTPQKAVYCKHLSCWGECWTCCEIPSGSKVFLATVDSTFWAVTAGLGWVGSGPAPCFPVWCDFAGLLTVPSLQAHRTSLCALSIQHGGCLPVPRRLGWLLVIVPSDFTYRTQTEIENDH